MITLLAVSAFPRVKGLMVLRDANILIGDIGHVQKQVPMKKKHSQARSETKNLFSVVVNLNAELSHPKFRDMLKTIRLLAHMLAQTCAANQQLHSLMRQLPDQHIVDYSEAMFEATMKNRLFDTFRKRMKTVMERIVTEYLDGLMKENNIKHCDDEPIVVSFGNELLYDFLCASSNHVEAIGMNDRTDFEDYLTLLRTYSLLAQSQCMLGNFIT